MKNKLLRQCLSVLVIIAVLLTALPITISAETTDPGIDSGETQNPSPDISDTEDPIPIYDVNSAEELQQALADQKPLIRITADFEIDRTFYVTYNTSIFASKTHTLTRKADFAGDVFVVGQDDEGNLYEDNIFTLGGSPVGGENLLIIDGNSQNMTVDVLGSIVFVCSNNQADLQSDLTIKNNKKVGNERAHDSAHSLTNTKYIGGAVAILAKDSLMNIYGGTYSNNSVNASGDSIYGGAFYNYATLNVYGGTFENNSAVRAGAFYNYRTLTITNATIKNNTGTSLGGAIYLPSSTSALLYLGTEDNAKKNSVCFIGNSSPSGGAIYSAGKIFMNDTLLESNSATESGGAIYGSGNYDVIKIKDSEFKSNTAADMAGAIYIKGQTTLSATEELNVQNTDFTENSAKNGGALYLAEGTRVYLKNANFTKNSTTANGGAITNNASNLEINGAKFTENSGYHGGALILTETAVAVLNNVTADGNTAKSNGGVINNTGSTLTIYNSNFKNNTAVAGSAAYLSTSSVNNIYKTKFIGNTCYDTNTSNAGALFIYTSGTETLLHSCTFIDNASSGLGGGLFISGKSIVKIYNITAIGNSAAKGGAIYETTSGTIVTISGMKVSGNAATVGGPIIWGNTANAKLFINKSNYADLDITGDLPSDYWSTAIANKLTVSDSDAEIPTYLDYGNESMGNMWDATDVATADELEAALNSGDKHIRITADIIADRTFYVTKSTTVFSTSPYKITRANSFDGNIFVVGKNSNGSVIEEKVTLTLGNKISTTKNLLTIDGNKDNMTVSVTGSAFLVTGTSQINLYDNITISNNQSNGNGAAALIEENAVMNIYGGTVENNQAVLGGAIYNAANLNVLSDALKNNTAENGGAIYNVGTLTTDGAVFTANNATYGGAVYTKGGVLQLTNATFLQNAAQNGGAVYVTDGDDSENSSLTVTSCDFSKNTAETLGGAIYSTAKNLDIGDSSFDKNSSKSNGGAVAFVSSTDTVLNNITAKDNTAKADGGFLYTDDATVRINTSVLTNNSAKNGGAVAFANSTCAKVLDTEFKNNQADLNGGAIYVCDKTTKAVVVESSFEQNIATDGGAISAEEGYIELTTVNFVKNTADLNGGAISLSNCENSLLSDVTADSNNAYGDGGFIYANGSYFNIYNSAIKNNTSGMDGGALALNKTECNMFGTDFENNISERNGGALYLYSKGTIVTILRCDFKNNSAEDNGGVIYSANQSILNLYEANTQNNEAVKGGVIYIGNDTQTSVNGITVSGNKADSGDFIYSNTYSATLNINKANYTDSNTQTLDKKYWDTVIAGKIKINENSDGIPICPEFDQNIANGIPSYFDVSSSQELEAAISAGEKYIRIIADFEIDRTFYITSEVTIFSTTAHTLTRAPGFAGDIFVVGETKDGVNSMLKKADAYLTLGNPASVTENLLTIDGNKDNMTVEVSGTVIFICFGAKADLHKNVTIVNCHKTDNERTYNEVYEFSRPNRIGGSVAILSQGVLNIYGGNYKNNSGKEEDTSTEEGRNSTNGGVFYNESNLRIYGGTFENNQGARGAIVYNYGIMRILGGSFINNHSTVIGGIYYSPNSASAHLAIGSTEQTDNPVLIKNNTAAQSAGVIYSGLMNGLVIYGNTVFEGNQALNGNGGVICVYGMLTARNTIFKDNYSSASGGAIYSSCTSETAKTRYVNISDCTFTNNQAVSGGAVALNATSSEYINGAIVNIENCEFVSNNAKSGGAISTDIKSQLTIKDSLFEQNTSESEAGVIYAEYQSVVDISGSTFTSNTSGSNGGVISLRSSYLNVDQTEFSNNTSGGNGGILYVSYLSSCDNNSDVVITNSLINGNHADSYGGAIYVTRRNIENDTQILTIKNTDFTQNSAGSNGGAILFTGNSESYLTDVTFTSNSAKEGGALCMFSSYVELDNAIFTRNTSKSSGGAVFMDSGSNAVMNNIAASRNQSTSHGGFLYGIGCQLKMYDSDIKNNSGVSGGGMYLYTDAVANIYNTDFNKNIARSQNGGALFIYTENSEENIIHSCKFDSNTAENIGGGMYVSGESLVKMYDLTATQNNAVNGGFMYLTKAGTVVDLSGLTVSGNTADGGPIIWGNTKNAILNIDKSNYTDLDHQGEYTNDYWSNAIKNLLTVNDTSIKVPEYDSYVSKDEPEKEVVRKEPVPVTDVLNLGLNSSDGSISSYYDKFEKLDNSSNFMSKGTTTFNNINGGTVTVDSFIYPPNSAKDNMNVGQGLMIYQALLYKQAFPQEEVYIDISSYRFSVQAGVNINRNSRYFGYMRNVTPGVDYDEYGFVRIAYLLITAAKMGIHVNVIGQVDGYPASTLDRNLYQYFTTQLEDPCDPAYVKNGIISDYLNFSYCEWTVGADGKGGTDMMHNKLCAVSHYLDMNGVAHKNAVWTSSANLDGIKNNGINGNWTLQTATIISDHEGIYRTSVNYLRLIAGLCEQEDIIEFQDIVNSMSTEQIDLILAGKENLIPKDKQIVYLGSASDNVFEMYFTPFGGGRLSWDEKYNPYCKYLRELYDSEDFIMFSWNAAQYTGEFPLGKQMETMITDAFHKNKHVNNVVYMNTETFDGSSFDDLIVGKDIGFKSFNTKDFGSIHNKDLLFSYSKDGQRYYVSLLNSCNMHSGSMYYQSNFALVIKETSCSDDSVYSIMAKHTTKGDMVHHEYGKIQTKPNTATEHGYTYKTCKLCDKEEIIDVLHHAGDWIIDRDATKTQNGIRHRECTICGKFLGTAESLYQEHLNFNYESLIGKTFTPDAKSLIPLELESVPLTLEALIQVPTTRTARAGVIVGNYKNSASKNSLNLEIQAQGKVRLFFTTAFARVDCVFSPDIRSDDPVHIAVTVDQIFANLYINGELAETKLLTGLISNDNKDNFVVGGDNREGNTQYFRGTIYSVNLFSDVRTAEEIKRDALLVTSDADNVLYSEYYTDNSETTKISAQTLGSLFNKNDIESIGNLSSIPQTVEATILLPTSYSARGGVITGNYGANTSNALNLEVLEKGKLRLYYINNGQKVDHTFATDIRSDKPINIAVTVDGTTATLFINGAITETAEVAYTLPSFSDKFCIGGDNREGNTQYFKGTIYSVNFFSNVRTAEEISKDMICVTKDSEYLLHSSYFTNAGVTAMNGQSFSQNVSGAIDCTLNGIPQTFEATVQVPKTINDRVGVIVGNYSDFNSTNAISLEIYKLGRVRLFFTNGQTRTDCIFPTDIRSDKPVNIAVTVEGASASLYIDGKYYATKKLATTLPETTNTLTVGGDYREGNPYYFQGTIYSVNLFGDVRTPDEIKQDSLLVNQDAEGLLFGGYYATQEAQTVGLHGIHTESRCIIDREATDSYNGVYHTECECCNKILTISEYSKDFTAVSKKDYSNDSGLDTTKLYRIEPLSSTPKTFEITMQLSPTHSARAGTIIGNYDGSTADQINIEIYTNGQPRLYCKSGTTSYTYLFKTDVRSDALTHLTFTVDKLTARLYVNGVLTETIALTEAVPSAYNNYCIGGDNRSGNAQAFQGNIYAVNLFSDVRTANEILFDSIAVTEDVDNRIFSEYFLAETSLKGKTIVNFGDSIFGNYVAPVDISTMIANKTDATVYNVGFGGAQMSETSNAKYDAFGMENLADAITTGDFSLQENYCTKENRFTAPFNTLKSIDFNSVDIITIAYGTNDFVKGNSLETIKNATKYSIETIQNKYPHIDIVLCTPVYRYWIDDTGNFIEDSNTKEINGIKLTDYIQLYKEIGKEYGLVVIDNYNGSGITASNRADCFTGTDTTHPNETGRQMIAENMANELYKYFG